MLILTSVPTDNGSSVFIKAPSALTLLILNSKVSCFLFELFTVMHVGSSRENLSIFLFSNPVIAKPVLDIFIISILLIFCHISSPLLLSLQDLRSGIYMSYEN